MTEPSDRTQTDQVRISAHPNRKDKASLVCRDLVPSIDTCNPSQIKTDTFLRPKQGDVQYMPVNDPGYEIIHIEPTPKSTLASRWERQSLARNNGYQR